MTVSLPTGFRTLALLIASAYLAACSSPAGSMPAAGSPASVSGKNVSASVAHRGKGRITVSIRIPRKHHGKRVRVMRNGRPEYISAATAGLTISIIGLQTLSETVSLLPNAQGCTSSLASTTCTLTIPGLAACPSPSTNCYSATIATYDAIAGCPSACSIPNSANQLSANSGVAFTVVNAQSNSLNITLEGLPSSVAIVADGSGSLSGTPGAGFALPKCTTEVEHVSVFGVDADNNYILGAGAPAVSLLSNDATHLAASAVSSSQPNRFALTPPSTIASATIPAANHVVQLTATATPLAGSGGVAKTLNANVTFNGDICGVLSEYTIPTGSSLPTAITAGPDGAVWFTEFAGGKIGRVTTTGSVTETVIPSGASLGFEGITTGSDGALWFTEANNSAIGRITTAGAASYTTVATVHGAGPLGITTGPDHNLWFTECNAAKIGKIVPATSVLAEYPTTSAGSEPQGISSGPGGLWFTEFGASKIGLMTTSGTASEPYPATYATSIAEAADGTMWFSECNFNLSIFAIGRIGTEGQTFPITSSIFTSGATTGIISGPDGALWFGSAGDNNVRRATIGATPVVTTTAVSGEPGALTVGPDGAIWFTESSNKIGRIQ
jgi:virginiamycin B lyase